MKIIISVAVAALIFIGCGQEKSKPVEAVVSTGKAPSTQEAPSTAVATAHKVDAVIESASKTADEVSTSVKEMSDTTVLRTKEIVESAKAATNDAIEATKEVAKDVADEVESSAAAVSESLSSTNEAGKEAYKACASCHGQNAEKPALGKSKIIKGWSASKTQNALSGYVDGTYGGPMKAIMKGQAARLSAEETKAVSEYISDL